MSPAYWLAEAERYYDFGFKYPLAQEIFEVRSWEALFLALWEIDDERPEGQTGISGAARACA